MIFSIISSIHLTCVYIISKVNLYITIEGCEYPTTHIRMFNKSKINVDLAQTKSGVMIFSLNHYLIARFRFRLHQKKNIYIYNQCGSTFQESKFKLNLLVKKKRNMK
jgi:hypothetical protein